MESADKSLILDFGKYLDRKKRKLTKAACGFDRGQHELIIQILKNLRKLEKRYAI